MKAKALSKRYNFQQNSTYFDFIVLLFQCHMEVCKY